MRKILLLGSLMTLCTAMSCDRDDYYVRFDENEFNNERMLWEKANNLNYSFHYSYTSSTGPIDIDVVVENGIQVKEAETPGSYTINDIYKMIENDFTYANTRDTNGLYGVTINVKYNKEYHYPEEIKYSVSFKGDVVGGGGYDAVISNFKMN